MQYLPLLGTILAIHFLAVASPGPDFVIVVKNALGYSRKTGIGTAVGVGLGIGLHVTYCVAGLAFIIAKSVVVFSLIKYLGAAYLIYIGIQSLRAKSTQTLIHTQEERKDMSIRQAVKMGFLTNVLNPKATMFFLGLFTMVISPSTPKAIMSIAGGLMVIDTMLWFSLVALFLTTKRMQKVYYKVESTVNKIFGGALILFGLKIALSKME